MDIQQLVSELRTAIEGARAKPRSSSAVVNRTEVLDLIGRIEAELPGAFAEAELVHADRDAIVAQGREEADRIIAEAEHERDRLVSESETRTIARRQADDLITEAKTEADALRRESDEYVDGRLAQLEVTLSRTLEAVNRGRKRLDQRSDLSGLGEGEHDDDSPFFSPDD